ncbi:MAG: glycosyl hydrolase [Mycobacteriales bacterium]
MFRKPAVVSLVLGFGLIAALAAPGAQASTPIFLGAAGDSQGLAQKIGAPLSDHAYAHFPGKVPEGRMITVEATESWRTTASARGGTEYNDIVRWAQTIKARGGTVMLAFHHEPEASGSASHGGPADFINAYRRVVTIFREQGAKNVVFTWQMTAWAFRTNPSDARYAAKWYPGDAYVDSVGADAYNWYTCGHGKGKNTSFATLADPVLAFARAHHKTASFPEFAMTAGSSRPSWLVGAHQYMIDHRDIVYAAFYFQRGPTVKANADCKWALNSSGDYKAYGDIAKHRTYFSP